jgi:predicted nucleotidyltransferase
MGTKTTRLSGELERRIVDALAPLQPEKVILFGSYAWAEPTADSDVDLYVVTQDDFLPATYEKRMQTHLKAAAVLREINKSVPIDLIVRPSYFLPRRPRSHPGRIPLLSAAGVRQESLG